MTNTNNITATNLDELLNQLRQMEAAGTTDSLEMDSLPTFGGSEPEAMDGIWSWDEKRILVGACIGTGDASDDLKIIDREVLEDRLIVTAAGGTRFEVYRQTGTQRTFLGSMEFGSIDSDGDYEQDDDEIIEAAREQYDIPATVPGVVA